MPTSNRELLYFVVQVCREPRIRITEVHDFFYALCPLLIRTNSDQRGDDLSDYFCGGKKEMVKNKQI